MRARRLTWWWAVPLGIALALALAVGIDRAAAPADAASGTFELTTQQLRINQRIAQQGVRRANRANARLDALKPGGGPAGPAGPPGPAGPGAARIAFAGPVGTPLRQVLDLDGVALSAGCEAGGGGETNLVISADLAVATTVIGTASGDQGTDPANPPPANTNNFQVDLPAGPGAALGGPSAPDGNYSRAIASLLFVTPEHTISLRAAVMADGIADNCSFNGVAVPS
jgi:hypothetical protein